VIVNPCKYFIFAIKLLIGIEALAFTEVSIMDAIWVESKLKWSSEIFFDKQVHCASIFFISHCLQNLLTVFGLRREFVGRGESEFVRIRGVRICEVVWIEV